MKFDWHKDDINAQTIITSHYRNTQNVRRYFISVCGESFRFNRAFMAWMKQSQGLTMGEAAEHWCQQYKK
ncbi:DUF6434 domain-containing protein [Veronia pacifica]